MFWLIARETNNGAIGYLYGFAGFTFGSKVVSMLPVGCVAAAYCSNRVLTIAGAGRGPLVACTLRAMQRSNRQATVYAIEKNANAFVT